MLWADHLGPWNFIGHLSLWVAVSSCPHLHSLMYIASHGSCSRSLPEMAVDLTENFTEQNN